MPFHELNFPPNQMNMNLALPPPGLILGNSNSSNTTTNNPVTPAVVSKPAPHVMLATINDDGKASWREFSCPIVTREVENWTGLTEIWFQTIIDFSNAANFYKKSRFQVDDTERLFFTDLKPSCGYLVCGYGKDDEENTEIPQQEKNSSLITKDFNQHEDKSHAKILRARYINEYLSESTKQQEKDKSPCLNKPAESLKFMKMRKVFGNDPNFHVIESYFGTYKDETFEDTLRTIFRVCGFPEPPPTKDFLIELKKESFGKQILNYYPLDAQIFHAIVVGDEKKLWFLLDRNCFKENVINPRHTDKHRRNLFHYLGIFGNLKLIDVILKKRPEIVQELINSRDLQERTPLHYAAFFDDENTLIIQEFLLLGAKPDLKDKLGLIPTHYAFFKPDSVNNFKILHRLSKTNPALDIVRVALPESSNIFHYAVKFPQTKTNFTYLVQSYPDPEFIKQEIGKKNQQGLTPFELSIQNSTDSDYFYFRSLITSFSYQELKLDTLNHDYCERIFSFAINRCTKSVIQTLMFLLTNVPGMSPQDRIQRAERLFAVKKVSKISKFNEDLASEMINLKYKTKRPENNNSSVENLSLFQESCYYGLPKIASLIMGHGIDVNYIPPRNAQIDIDSTLNPYSFECLSRFLPPIMLVFLGTQPNPSLKTHFAKLAPDKLKLNMKIGILQRSLLHELIIRSPMPKPLEEAETSYMLFCEFLITIQNSPNINEILNAPDALGYTPLAYAYLMKRRQLAALLERYTDSSLIFKKSFISVSPRLQNSENTAFFNPFILPETISSQNQENDEKDDNQSSTWDEFEIHKRYSLIFDENTDSITAVVTPISLDETIRIYKRILEIKNKMKILNYNYDPEDRIGVPLINSDGEEDPGQEGTIKINLGSLKEEKSTTSLDKYSDLDNKQLNKSYHNDAILIFRIIDLCFQISELHTAVGLIHGNICKDAVRFTEDYDVILTCFGFPFEMDPNIYQYPHLAPEIQKSGFSCCNVASDIYSFAHVACSMLGRAEFQDLDTYLQSVVGTLHQITNNVAYQIITQVFLQMGCLRPEPNQRPKSMLDVLKKLVAISKPYLTHIHADDYGYTLEYVDDDEETDTEGSEDEEEEEEDEIDENGKRVRKESIKQKILDRLDTIIESFGKNDHEFGPSFRYMKLNPIAPIIDSLISQKSSTKSTVLLNFLAKLETHRPHILNLPPKLPEMHWKELIDSTELAFIELIPQNPQNIAFESQFLQKLLEFFTFIVYSDNRSCRDYCFVSNPGLINRIMHVSWSSRAKSIKNPQEMLEIAKFLIEMTFFDDHFYLNKQNPPSVSNDAIAFLVTYHYDRMFRFVLDALSLRDELYVQKIQQKQTTESTTPEEDETTKTRMFTLKRYAIVLCGNLTHFLYLENYVLKDGKLIRAIILKIIHYLKETIADITNKIVIRDGKAIVSPNNNENDEAFTIGCAVLLDLGYHKFQLVLERTAWTEEEKLRLESMGGKAGLCLANMSKEKSTRIIKKRQT